MRNIELHPLSTWFFQQLRLAGIVMYLVMTPPTFHYEHWAHCSANKK